MYIYTYILSVLFIFIVYIRHQNIDRCMYIALYMKIFYYLFALGTEQSTKKKKTTNVLYILTHPPFCIYKKKKR